MARQCDVAEFCRWLGAEQRQEVERALAAGMGLANYGGTIFTYGHRDATISGLPPRVYGDHELDEFVSPTPSPATMRSPLMDAVGGPPQIRRPPVSQAHTEYPSVQIEMRTSPHPRDKSGFIDVQHDHLLPGRDREQPEPLRELTESEQWWAKRLLG
jgi:hypothetical protein